jgi:alkylation response protein AidB-like acyl-CoA dehydrogenase
MVGAMVHEAGGHDWVLLMIPPGAYTVRDTWFTAGMRGTGSNTIVTDNVFVPAAHALRLAELRDGRGAGGALHASLIYRVPFFFYAPITFAAPMLGAARGAYAHFRDWVKKRQSADGSFVAERVSTQVRLARAAADLDAADMLLERASLAHHGPEADWPALVARSVRDFSRVSEFTVAAIDTLIALSGTAGFASSHPVQRAWRDIHFASTHISVNTETNYSHFGRLEMGLPRDPSRPFF